MMQGTGRQSECECCPTLHLFDLGGEYLPTTDLIVGAQANYEANAEPVLNFDPSGPISANKICTVCELMPGTAVKTTPNVRQCCAGGSTLDSNFFG